MRALVVGEKGLQGTDAGSGGYECGLKSQQLASESKAAGFIEAASNTT
ncbi:hypothetical protein BQ8794_220112 [Mesorhizobium prunaredense]|uniref:Uncharacterized protein n=1 Tax=Mesorhizobium prunaredense TaxID=1631249 RepID=A0A1R3V6N2_9HYPH|nr:hypothetical protein BQ8794_220112 [Mesorhizobium prunaredense]